MELAMLAVIDGVCVVGCVYQCECGILRDAEVP